jgi:acyl-CoA thioesterase
MDANALARACADALWEDDSASRDLHMQLISAEPGHAVLAMSVTESMVNGHQVCHGGYIFALAESALNYASNTYNHRTVPQHCDITFLNSARLGDRLVANAIERQRSGRSGVYDVTVTREEGSAIAELRGLTRMIDGEIVPGAQIRGALGARS